MARKTKKEIVTLGLIQMSAGEKTEDNLAKAMERIAAAAKKGAQIVCLQELFRSRYFCQSENQRNFRLAESIPGPTTEALSALAEARQIVIVASVFERRSAGVYHNTAVNLDAEGSIPGIQTRYAKVGALVCWDQWFPEGARSATLSGAQILIYPTAIGWIPNEPKLIAGQQRDAWELIQRSHAIANGVYVASVNRVGREGRIKFWGNSFVAGPFGEIVAHADGEREEILLANCDLGRTEEIRQSWPFLRDRRIDAYGPLLSRSLEDDKRR